MLFDLPYIALDQLVLRLQKTFGEYQSENV